MIVGISILTFFDVKVSTAILGVALVGEVAILTIFAVGVFTNSGAHVDIAAINPINAFRGFDAHEKLAAGAAGIGLFFAFWSWVGFEMAPNYAEESRDPKRIVPLSLCLGAGARDLLRHRLLGSGLGLRQDRRRDRDVADQLSQLLLRSGDAPHRRLGCAPDEHPDLDAAPSLAAWPSTIRRPAISIPSAASGSCRPRSARPMRFIARRYIASFTQSIIAAIIILIFAIKEGSGDPTTQAYLEVYGLMALVGTILIVASQAVVSLAIIAYFRKHHPDDHHWWKTLVAPVIAFVTQAYVVYLCVANMDFLGGGLRFADYIVWIDLAVLVVGILGAFYIKASDPEKYDKIGRLIYEGVPERP